MERVWYIIVYNFTIFGYKTKDLILYFTTFSPNQNSIFLLIISLFIGLYISRMIKQGRAISVPNFGLFTFSAPEVTLKVRIYKDPKNLYFLNNIYQQIFQGTIDNKIKIKRESLIQISATNN